MKIQVDADLTQLKLAFANIPVEIQEKKGSIFLEFDNTKIPKQKILDIVSRLMSVHRTKLDPQKVLKRLSGLGVTVKKSGAETLVYYKDIKEEDIVLALQRDDLSKKEKQNPIESAMKEVLKNISNKPWGNETQSEVLKIWAMENNLLDPQTMRFNKFE